MTERSPWLLVGSALASVGMAVVLARVWRRGPADGLRDVRSVEAPVWVTAALLVFMAPMVGGSIAAQLPESIVGKAESVKQVAMTQVAGFGLALVAALAAVVLIRRGAGPGERTGLTARPADLLLGLIGLLAVVPFYVLTSESATWIERAVSQAATDPVKHTTLKMLGAAFDGSSGADRAWAIVIVVSVVTVVPAVEELLYRGFLQSFLVRTMTPDGPRWRAVVMTSVIFSLMHVATGVVPWSAAAALFTLSIGLGLAFERTGRIGVPIVMHGLFNAANVAAVALGAGAESAT